MISHHARFLVSSWHFTLPYFSYLAVQIGPDFFKPDLAILMPLPFWLARTLLKNLTQVA
jgi:hypothetical protein